MAKLVSMKRSKEKVKKDNTIGPSDEQYPYGLELRFSDESLDKLDMEDDLPQVGDVMEITALGRVTEISSRQAYGDEDGENRCLSVQITDICLEPSAKVKRARMQDKMLNSLSGNKSA